MLYQDVIPDNVEKLAVKFVPVLIVPFFFFFLKTRRVSKGPESMTLGQRVIGRNSDGWYYHCTIIGMATQIFYEVNFDDGSYCDNLHPENVLVSVYYHK